MQTTVLVRAYGDEPRKCVAVKSGDNVIYVANPDSLERVRNGLTTPVGVPKADVFDFDENLAKRLAIDPSLWKEAVPFAMLKP